MNLIASFKQGLKKTLRSRGYELYKRPWLPRGVDPWETIQALKPDFSPEVILDVGANEGETALRLSDSFPSAKVHAFEPVSATFSKLQARVRNRREIHAHQLAIGAAEGKAAISLQAHSTLNSLRAPGDTSQGPEESATLTTLDRFCSVHRIPRIHILKTDTEGHEMEVLEGASRLLESGMVDFILVEVAFVPTDRRFVPLNEVAGRLQPFGFGLIGLFDQRGWTHRLLAEFGDALFARRSILPR